MSSPTGWFPSFFSDRGVDLAALGGAYLVLLATLILTAAAFLAERRLLLVSPNRGTRDYGIYVSVTLATLLIATVLENETLPYGAATLRYVAVPQILLLLALHLAIWNRQDPWLIEVGAGAVAATIVVGALLGLTTALLSPAYGIVLVLLTILLGFLWIKAVSTQRAFMTADSIYVRSKEMASASAPPQKPWLGLTQWVALIAASIALAIANSLLRGSGLEEIPAVEVARESGLLLFITMTVCAVPAMGYWMTRKAWMPELTRFVWLAWLVVGFALTYGNYLGSLEPT
jgi:hypothetical protein